jgi:hypothetical protein
VTLCLVSPKHTIADSEATEAYSEPLADSFLLSLKEGCLLMTRFSRRMAPALIAALLAPFLFTPQAFAQTGSWMIVNSPVASAQLNGVAAVSGSDIWAVGEVFSDNFVHTTLAEHWDGTAWTSVSTPNASQSSNVLNAVTALSNSNVWAVGSSDLGTLIEHWNGTDWTIVSSPLSGTLTAVAATAPNDIWAVGYDTQYNALIEHFNGTTWSSVPAPAGTLVLRGVTALAGNNAWAVGSNGIVHWNGNAWGRVPTPPVGNGDPFSLAAITALSANDIWAVGTDFANVADNSVDAALTEHWNGAAWSVVFATGPVLGSDADLYGVAASASNDVWTVGASAGSLIEQFTGRFWNPVASPPALSLQAVTTVVGSVWAVGYTSTGPVIMECQGC